MPEGLDYAMRPVRAGMCRYEALTDGTLTLRDLGIMNDALDAEDENRRRAEATRPKPPQR